MKVTLKLFFGLLLTANAVAEQCIEFPALIEKAVNAHISEIRAAEYCKARKLTSENDFYVAIYTAEGQCLNDLNFPSGSCGNQWYQYMIGLVGHKVIGPIAVGGKGGLSAKEILIQKNVIYVSGAAIGPNDPLCCPTVSTTKLFNYSQDGFTKVQP